MALSTAEAEYVTACSASCEEVWLRKLLSVIFSITNLWLQVKIPSMSKVVCCEVEKGTREILDPIPRVNILSINL